MLVTSVNIVFHDSEIDSPVFLVVYEYHQHRFKNKEQAKTEQNVSNGMERIKTLFNLIRASS